MNDNQKNNKANGERGRSFLFRAVHWLLAITIPLLIYTGLANHAMARPGWSLFFDHYPAWLGSVRVLFWHLILAIVFTASLLAAFYAYLRRGRIKRLKNSSRWKMHVHIILFVSGGIMLASGLVLLRTWGGGGAHQFARVMHLGFGLGVTTLMFVLHTVLGLTRHKQLLVESFSITRGARWSHLFVFAGCTAVAAVLMLNLPQAPAAGKTLVVKPISPTPLPLNELPWSETRPLDISLTNGANFGAGTTEVELRALHDGDTLFVQASWTDATEDRRNRPWEKTATGWKRLVTIENDETVYYEDKFSLLFPIQPSAVFDATGCAMSCHGGGDRPYGYKSSPIPLDVWHWKATRTDPAGQVDDKYWNDDGPEEKDAGRHGDPKESGGYSYNYNEEKTRPAFLPTSPDSVKSGGLFADKAIPWSAKLEAGIPEDTIIPGMVVSPFIGDRGDVTCESHHEDGRWLLWMKRKLDTGSEHDVVFEPGQTYSFGCAAFDCAAKRHAYNHDVYRMHLEQPENSVKPPVEILGTTNLHTREIE